MGCGSHPDKQNPFCRIGPVTALTRSNDFLSHCYSGISGRVEQAKRVADVPRLKSSQPVRFSFVGQIFRPAIQLCSCQLLCDSERRAQN